MGFQFTQDYLIRRSVHRFADNIAFIDGDKRISYKEFDQRINQLINGLLSLGVKKGDRVAVLINNSIYCAECFFAIWKAGFVLVPLNTRLSNEEFEYILNHSESNTLIYDTQFEEVINKIRSKLTSVKNFISLGEIVDINYESLINTQSTKDPMIKIDENDLSAIRYTSGTTGKPKGVMLSVKNDIASAINIMYDTLKSAEGDVFAHIAPITHASGSALLPFFMAGGTSLILKEFEPEQLMKVIEKEKVTTLFLVPTMILFIINHPNFDKYDLSSLQQVLYGAAPMSPEHIKIAQMKLGNILQQGYGLTEAPTQCTLLSTKDHLFTEDEKNLKRLNSAGRELTLVKVKIVDENGNEVPIGETGEIAIKGNHVMQGYWKNPEATNEVFKDGWLLTGDMGYLDEDCYLYIVDRKQDMIISGGFNIYPKEVEDALHEHEAVFQSAVVGVPGKEWGENVKAFVKLKDGYNVSESELINFVRQKIASYKKPKSIEFVDYIPVNANGKVMRRELRQKYWDNVTENNR